VSYSISLLTMATAPFNVSGDKAGTSLQEKEQRSAGRSRLNNGAAVGTDAKAVAGGFREAPGERSSKNQDQQAEHPRQGLADGGETDGQVRSLRRERPRRVRLQS
jgi:hypothetical protein